MLELEEDMPEEDARRTCSSEEYVLEEDVPEECRRRGRAGGGRRVRLLWVLPVPNTLADGAKRRGLRALPVPGLTCERVTAGNEVERRRRGFQNKHNNISDVLTVRGGREGV